MSKSTKAGMIRNPDLEDAPARKGPEKYTR